MPKWQIMLLFALVAVAIAGTVMENKNSYAHLFVTGQCFGTSIPDICHRGRGGW
jgi:hypothetical protein